MDPIHQFFNLLSLLQHLCASPAKGKQSRERMKERIKSWESNLSEATSDLLLRCEGHIIHQIEIVTGVTVDNTLLANSGFANLAIQLDLFVSVLRTVSHAIAVLEGAGILRSDVLVLHGGSCLR